MTRLINSDLGAISLAAKKTRTPADLRSLAQGIHEKNGPNFSSLVDSIEKDAVQSGVYLDEKTTARLVGISLSQLRRRRLVGHFPSGDQISTGRIANNRFSVMAYVLLVMAHNAKSVDAVGEVK